MSKEENFDDYWKKFGNPLSNTVRFSCFHTWNYQQAKLDKANEEINIAILEFLRETKQLKEALKEAVEVIESYSGFEDGKYYGPGDIYEDISDVARQFLESEQYKKVEGSL